MSIIKIPRGFRLVAGLPALLLVLALPFLLLVHADASELKPMGCITLEQRVVLAKKIYDDDVALRGPLVSIKDGSPLNKLGDTYAAYLVEPSGIHDVVLMVVDPATRCPKDGLSVLVKHPNGAAVLATTRLAPVEP